MTVTDTLVGDPRRWRGRQFIPSSDSVRGFVYDVETGTLSEVS